MGFNTKYKQDGLLMFKYPQREGVVAIRRCCSIKFEMTGVYAGLLLLMGLAPDDRLVLARVGHKATRVLSWAR